MSSTGLPGWLSLPAQSRLRITLIRPTLPTLNSTGAPSAVRDLVPASDPVRDDG